MGLRRRFERLLRPSSANRSGLRSASESRTGQEKNLCHDEQRCRRQRRLLPLDAQKPPQFGRRGPASVGEQQHQLLRLSEQRRGNHYASFSTSSSSSSRTSAPGGCSSCCSAASSAKWQPPAQLQFVRLEAAEASEASCSVAELSASGGQSSSTSASSAASSTSPTAVYEEIQEPLYDRVAACSSGDVEADADAAAEIDDFDSAVGIHCWRYSSLPRRWQRRSGRGQQQQQQLCPPLGCTQVDWRGVKCTSF